MGGVAAAAQQGRTGFSTRYGEQGVRLGTSLDGTRFDAVGTMAHRMLSQVSPLGIHEEQ